MTREWNDRMTRVKEEYEGAEADFFTGLRTSGSSKSFERVQRLTSNQLRKREPARSSVVS